MAKLILTSKLTRRQIRSRAGLKGTATRPRCCVRRTNTQVLVQLINDEQATTLAAASDRELTTAAKKHTKSERALLVGELLGKKARELGIKAVVFDRHGYLYHGRVRNVADGLRKAGLSL